MKNFLYAIFYSIWSWNGKEFLYNKTITLAVAEFIWIKTGWNAVQISV